LWFRQKMSVLDLSARPEALIHHTAARLEHDLPFRERVVRLLRHADLGISDLELPKIIHSSSASPPNPDDADNPELPTILFGRPVSSSWFHEMTGQLLQSVHRTPDGEAVRFDFLEAESNGTQRFFALAGPWLDALDQGALLVLDELDCSMH